MPSNYLIEILHIFTELYIQICYYKCYRGNHVHDFKWVKNKIYYLPIINCWYKTICIKATDLHLHISNACMSKKYYTFIMKNINMHCGHWSNYLCVCIKIETICKNCYWNIKIKIFFFTNLWPPYRWYLYIFFKSSISKQEDF